MPDLHNILKRLSQVVGVDGLAEICEKSRTEPAKPEIDRIRESLPNRQARSRYDKELKKQKREKRAQKQVKRSNLRMIQRLRDRLDKLDNPKPALIPADLWRNCQCMIADSTGKVIREFANQMANKIALTRIHRAALGMYPETVQDSTMSNTDANLTRAYSYSGSDIGALRARRIFALGYLLVHLSKGTARKGKYNRLVAGIPQAAFIGALRDPYSGHQVFRTTLSGRHRYEGQAGELGYLDALKVSGLLYTRQAVWRGDEPTTKGWKDIRPEEIAGEKDGWKFSLDRYWIITSQYTSPKEAADKAILWVDFMAGLQPWEVWLQPEPESDVHGKTSDICPDKPPD